MPSIDVDLCLFDLDGTLVNTTAAAENSWRRLCSRHGVDPKELLQHSHGSRTDEVLEKFFPKLDNSDGRAAKELEMAIAKDFLPTVRLVPGAEQLLLSLDKDTEDGSRVHDRNWAIVTSGSRVLAFSWFKTLLKNVQKPDVFVTAADVKRGKPDPQGYTMARDELCRTHELEYANARTVVFEDAPAGIIPGKKIKAVVVGITTTYPKEVLFKAGADYVVEDLSGVIVTRNDRTHGITIEIRNALSK